MSAEQLLSTPNKIIIPKDNTPTWIQNKYGVKSCVPKHVAIRYLQDKNKGFELCDPEFVPKKTVRPVDDGKKDSAKKLANTEKTYTEIEEITTMKVQELRDYAKKNEIDLNGAKTKKEILEAIEAAGKLY